MMIRGRRGPTRTPKPSRPVRITRRQPAYTPTGRPSGRGAVWAAILCLLATVGFIAAAKYGWIK